MCQSVADGLRPSAVGPVPGLRLLAVEPGHSCPDVAKLRSAGWSELGLLQRPVPEVTGTVMLSRCRLLTVCDLLAEDRCSPTFVLCR